MDAPPPPHEEPNTPTLKYKTWVLKVSIHCVGCKRKVKKVLQTIEGVYTIDIDSKQHKVTVVGNVEIDVLLKKLHKTGKHAGKWPENPSKKDKNPANATDKDHESSSDDEDDNNNNNNTNSNSNNSNSNTNSNPASENGTTPGKVTSGGPSVKFAGVPESGTAPAGDQMGGGKKKKKKKKGKKSSGAGAKMASGGVADSGSSTVGGDAGTTTTQVVEQGHLSPPRGYNSYPMPAGPAYAVCYSEARPTGNGGAAYYIPSIPYTYEEEEEDDYGRQFERLSRPSNTFEMLSDENPYGCYVM